jgi:excisionase family DNA binding protein
MTPSENARRVLVTLPELARSLGVSASWLRREADANRLPHLKAGNQCLFHAEVVERILAARAAQSPEASDGA